MTDLGQAAFGRLKVTWQWPFDYLTHSWFSGCFERGPL